MSSTTNSSKVVGSTFVVTRIDLDKDDSTVSFALTKNDKQFCFLNTVSTSLNRHSCEPNNIFVNLPKGVSKKVCLDKCSHSTTNWNREVKFPLRRLDFKGFFELLDKRSNDNDFVFILEKLDKNELKHQFDVHNVVFKCNFRDGELCKILTPSLEELSLFRQGTFDNYNNCLVHRLACNICRCYKWKDTDTGYTPDCRPFDCYHYCYSECLESWKLFHLKKIRELQKQ